MHRTGGQQVVVNFLVDVAAVDIAVPDRSRVDQQHRAEFAAVEGAGHVHTDLALARQAERLNPLLRVIAHLGRTVVVAAGGAGFALVAAEEDVVAIVAHRQIRRDRRSL